MGWNSWNTFQCSINEALIRGVADTFVTSGMAAAGYQYVNLDDCWMNGRDATGKLHWDTTKFPAGIPALAAYVHGKGLKLGIYESANSATCVGVYGPQHARGRRRQPESRGAGRADLRIVGRRLPQVRSLHGQPRVDHGDGQRPARDGATDRLQHQPGQRHRTICSRRPRPAGTTARIANMWRIGFDINASWASVLSLIDQDAPLARFASPGHWNDPDMLEVGKGLTADEDRSHFSMWAMLAAPLIAGNDIRSMSAATQAILTNADVIAVDQDPLGMQGQIAATPATNLQVWSKPLAGTNTRAVALFNRGTAAASITVQWTDIGIPAGNATVRDLWQHAASARSTTATRRRRCPRTA